MSDLVKCPYCAALIQPDAKKCRYCGEWPDSSARPTCVEADDRFDAPLWETCVIVFDAKGLLSIQYQFWAKAIGPDGVYSAGNSVWFPRRSWTGTAGPWSGDPRATVAFDTLVVGLVTQGWEAVPITGEDWFSQRFRRRVTRAKPPQPK